MDTHYKVIDPSPSGELVDTLEETITPDNLDYSETVKVGTKPTELVYSNKTITGCQEDCIDIVTAVEGGKTVTEEVTLSDNHYISGGNTDQAITLKGGCEEWLVEYSRFEGMFNRADIVLGDYVKYWPVKRIRGGQIIDSERTDRKPIVVWCLWADKPTVIGSNVKFKLGWVPPWFYFCLFTVLHIVRQVRGKKKVMIVKAIVFIGLIVSGVFIDKYWTAVIRPKLTPVTKQIEKLEAQLAKLKSAAK